MQSLLKKVRLFVVLCALGSLLSGCFLRSLFTYIGQREEDNSLFYIATIGGFFGPMAVCTYETGEATNTTYEYCTYTFLDFESELPFLTTSTAELIAELGWFGVLIDPLILQVPATATDFSGDMNSGSGPQPFVITETTSFLATPTTRINAEPGQKFVIVEFPASIEEQLRQGATLNGPFDFNFTFRLPGPDAVTVKPMYTGKVVTDGATYYVPLLPCVTDFAQAPSFTIAPAGSGGNPLSAIIAAVRQDPALGCDGAVYDLRASGGTSSALFLPYVAP